MSMQNEEVRRSKIGFSLKLAIILIGTYLVATHQESTWRWIGVLLFCVIFLFLKDGEFKLSWSGPWFLLPKKQPTANGFLFSLSMISFAQGLGILELYLENRSSMWAGILGASLIALAATSFVASLTKKNFVI